MKIGSLCSGIGGLERGVESVLGGRTVWQADNKPFPQELLAKRFPHAEIYGDITKMRGDAIERVDVLTAGFPCFVAGTVISGSDRPIRIEDVKPGDMVLTHRNRHRKVLSVMSRQGGDTYYVKSKTSILMETTPEHPFWACRRLEDGTMSDPEWVEAKALNSSHWIAHPPNPAHAAPPPISVELAYLIGRFLGDGWILDGKRSGRKNSLVYKVVVCCSHDEKDELRQRIINAGFRPTISKCRATYKMIICSRELTFFFAQFGRYAHGKHLPEWVFSLPREQASELLKGYVDADGHEEHGTTRSCSVSRPLTIGISRLVRYVTGQDVSIGTARVKPTVNIEGRVCRQRAWHRVSWLKRKHSTTVDGYRFSQVVASAPSGHKKQVFNLEVEEDNSYVADDVVVHNCQPASTAGKRQGRSDERWIFPEVIRIAHENKTPWLLFENVSNLLRVEDGAAFYEVLERLHGHGYDAVWTVFPAYLAGAPHKRDRIFIVAKYVGRRGVLASKPKRFDKHGVMHAGSLRPMKNRSDRDDPMGLWPTPVTTDCKSAGRHTTDPSKPMHPGTSLTDATRYECRVEEACALREAALWPTPMARDHRSGSVGPDLVDATGRPLNEVAHRETARGEKGLVLNPEWVELLMGFPIGYTNLLGDYGEFPGWPAPRGKPQFGYEPPRLMKSPKRGSYESSSRVQRIFALGNAVVPQQAAIAAGILKEWMQRT